MRNKIEGVLTAIVTPFDAEGALNLPGLARQVTPAGCRERHFCGEQTASSLC
jgi:hypothetical protein